MPYRHCDRGLQEYHVLLTIWLPEQPTEEAAFLLGVFVVGGVIARVSGILCFGVGIPIAVIYVVNERVETEE